ncbi:MAG TPA: serine hydrolase [Anseongella sp.]
MKTLRKTLSKFALVLLVLPAIFSACEQVADKGIDEIAAPGFDLNKFEQNIIDTYSGQVTGYSYAISVGDKVERFGAGGNARIAADGLKAYTPETRQELFSVTKFVTAIAVCKVMDAKGKTLSEKVVDYLPTYWQVHSSYSDLTFEQLLSHYSGFSMENRGYDSLKTMMSIPQTANTFNYNNANFALCRILLPYLYYGKAYFKSAENQDINEAATAFAFRSLIRELVLKPAQLEFYDLADFKNWNHEGIRDYSYARYYLNSDLSVPSTGNSDDVLISGSRGLTLSSYEVAEILTAYENNLLITASWVNEMKIKKCGFDGAGVNGTHGTYYWKNGGGTNSEGAGGETIIMIFPNEVRVSLNCNSNRFTDDQFVGKPANMAQAYDDAW